jgi:hypothetical protein
LLIKQLRSQLGPGYTEGTFKCPVTGKEVEETALKKVFFS